MNLVKRGTLLIKSGTYHRSDLRHFNIVCTDPDEKDRQLIVSISSIKDGQEYDPACVLDDHEHRFIRHPSFVKYEFAKIAYRRQLLRKLDNKTALPYPPSLTEEVFKKVLKGIDVSEFVEPRFRDHYHRSLLCSGQANRLRTAPSRPRCADFRYRPPSADPGETLTASPT